MKKTLKGSKKFSLKTQKETLKLRDECIKIIGVLYAGLMDQDNILISSGDKSNRFFEIAANDIYKQEIIEKRDDGDIIAIYVKKDALVGQVVFETAGRLAEIAARFHKAGLGRPSGLGGMFAGEKSCNCIKSSGCADCSGKCTCNDDNSALLNSDAVGGLMIVDGDNTNTESFGSGAGSLSIGGGGIFDPLSGNFNGSYDPTPFTITPGKFPGLL